VGTEPNRHVVIGPSDDNPVKDRAPRRERRGNRDGERRREREPRGEYVIERPVREVRKFVSRSTPTQYADDFVPTERTHSEAESSATLYGRIDL
jgi:hypothetical protein